MNDIIRVVMEIGNQQEFLVNARGGNYFDTLAEAFPDENYVIYKCEEVG